MQFDDQGHLKHIVNLDKDLIVSFTEQGFYWYASKYYFRLKSENLQKNEVFLQIDHTFDQDLFKSVEISIYFLFKVLPVVIQLQNYHHQVLTSFDHCFRRHNP